MEDAFPDFCGHLRYESQSPPRTKRIIPHFFHKRTRTTPIKMWLVCFDQHAILSDCMGSIAESTPCVKRCFFPRHPSPILLPDWDTLKSADNTGPCEVLIFGVANLPKSYRQISGYKLLCRTRYKFPEKIERGVYNVKHDSSFRDWS